MLKSLPLIFMVLLGMGCSTSGQYRPDVGYGAEPTIKSLDALGAGDTVSLDGDLYTVAGQYLAASGRSCLQLRPQDGVAMRAACKENRSGNWYARAPLGALTSIRLNSTSSYPAGSSSPSMLGEGAQESRERSGQPVLVNPDEMSAGQLPVESLVQVPVINSIEDEPEVVKAGETLWKFAKRVTGNALNWSLIAEHNQITDVTAVKEGDLLYIPAQLSRSGEGG